MPSIWTLFSGSRVANIMIIFFPTRYTSASMALIRLHFVFGTITGSSQVFVKVMPSLLTACQMQELLLSAFSQRR